MATINMLLDDGGVDGIQIVIDYYDGSDYVLHPLDRLCYL